MSDRVMMTALLCVTVLGGLALWLSPETGKEITAAAVGALGGVMAGRAST